MMTINRTISQCQIENEPMSFLLEDAEILISRAAKERRSP
jgi:hypothetical protein